MSALNWISAKIAISPPSPPSPVPPAGSRVDQDPILKMLGSGLGNCDPDFPRRSASLSTSGGSAAANRAPRTGGSMRDGRYPFSTRNPGERSLALCEGVEP